LAHSDAEILVSYPTIGPEDVAAAWEYYAANQEEIDHDIRENEEDDIPPEYTPDAPLCGRNFSAAGCRRPSATSAMTS